MMASEKGMLVKESIITPCGSASEDEATYREDMTGDNFLSLVVSYCINSNHKYYCSFYALIKCGNI